MLLCCKRNLGGLAGATPALVTCSMARLPDYFALVVLIMLTAKQTQLLRQKRVLRRAPVLSYSRLSALRRPLLASSCELLSGALSSLPASPLSAAEGLPQPPPMLPRLPSCNGSRSSFRSGCMSSHGRMG